MKNTSYKRIAWTVLAIALSAMQFALAHGNTSSAGGGLPG
jgi:hypothetical protein